MSGFDALGIYFVLQNVNVDDCVKNNLSDIELTQHKNTQRIYAAYLISGEFDNSVMN